MKRKTVRLAKTPARAAQPRRRPRKASLKAKATKAKRPVAKRKTVRKKAVVRSVRARKPALAASKPKRLRRPAKAPSAPEPLGLGLKQLPQAPTTLAVLVAQAQAAPPPRRSAPEPAAGPKAAPAQPPFQIPPILLEGDEPSRPSASGLGAKYAVGPTPPAPSLGPEEAGLPETYGTGKLFLAARDPHYLYAHWDLNEAQRRRHVGLSAAQPLMLRVYLGSVAGEPMAEVQLAPEARHEFLRVGRAGTSYVAQLGFYQPAGEWVSLVVSETATTPPETVAEDKTVRWATVPEFATFAPREEARPVVPVPEAAPPSALAGLWHERVTEVRPPWRPTAEPWKGEVAASSVESEPAGLPPTWTVERERALLETVGMALARQRRTGSAEVTELVGVPVPLQVRGRPAQRGLPAPSGVPVSVPSPAIEVLGISSQPGGQPAAPRGFWFNVNAELVIYGATEPNARVTIGGRPLRLRPDGTFSCRFALPDGQYDLPVAAKSVDDEVRRADLAFSRRTEYRGEVGAHPQDTSLKPPAAESIPPG